MPVLVKTVTLKTHVLLVLCQIPRSGGWKSSWLLGIKFQDLRGSKSCVFLKEIPRCCSIIGFLRMGVVIPRINVLQSSLPESLGFPSYPLPLDTPLKNLTILEFRDYTQNPTLMGLEPSILREVLGFLRVWLVGIGD